MSKSWDELFLCIKCGGPVTVKVMKGVQQYVVVGKCSNGHRKKFMLSKSNIDKWITALTTHFFKCVACDAPVVYNPIHRGPWVKVQITCPSHGKNETRLLPMDVYNALMQIKHPDRFKPISLTPSSVPTSPSSTPVSPSSAPTCKYCGGVTAFIPQYSRYFCYRCQRYVEDHRVVEKVRHAPEIDDLIQKLKGFAATSEKNIPYAISDIPFELNMPNVDAFKIETVLNDMIIRGEVNGELDPATGEITFLDAPIITKRAPTPPLAAISTEKSQFCAKCGSELEYVEAKGAFFCRQCFEYTEAAPTTAPAPFSEGTVEAVRDFDYVGGQVRFKVAIRNKAKLVVTNIGVDLDVPTEFKLVRILPEASLDDLNRGLSKIDKLMPNSSQGIDYYLEPVACGTGVIAGIVKFQDAQGNYKSISVKPREIAIKCPLIFTPEEANIAMIRNLMKNLNKDFRRWALPTNPPDSFTLLHDIINQFEITHIQAFQISGEPYQIESWYYTRTKSTNHPIALRIDVSEQKNTMDLTIACEDMAELTGLLAKISEDFREKVNNKLHITPKPAFGSLKELICQCGSPIPKLPTLSENVTCNSCQKLISWNMLG